MAATEETARKRILPLSDAIEEMTAAIHDAEDAYSATANGSEARRLAARRLVALDMGRQALDADLAAMNRRR